MIKRVINKIKRSKKIIDEGILPANGFDAFYQNPQIFKEEYNQAILSDDEANVWLQDMVINGKPFFASRFGNAELGLVCNHFFNKMLNRNYWSPYSKYIIERDPAWQGDIEKQARFYDSFLRAVSNIDGLGIWYNHGEQVMANYVCSNAVLFDLRAYEPFFHKQPWTLALEEKKVLVIHPYKDSIIYQYDRKDIIFNYPVLPSFKLITYQPFSTYNDDWKLYNDAEEALEKMITDVSAIEFDIALIACGPFGLPLGSAIKNMGKQAIHIGGALQLFFGILGKRWELPGNPQSAFFNEHWKRPFPQEIPTDPRVLMFSDNGCYW